MVKNPRGCVKKQHKQQSGNKNAQSAARNPDHKFSNWIGNAVIGRMDSPSQPLQYHVICVVLASIQVDICSAIYLWDIVVK